MVNIEGARKARVPICSNGGANSVAVAEHAIMLMLAVYRKLIAFHQNVTAGRWHSGIPRAVSFLGSIACRQGDAVPVGPLDLL